MTPLTARFVACLAAAAVPAVAAFAASAPTMQGFTAASAEKESALEARFDAGLSAKEMKGWLERMSSAPNQVGSPHDKANADFMLEEFKKWGWDASIETFYVLYPTPKRELLELVAPSHYRATLTEPRCRLIAGRPAPAG